MSAVHLPYEGPGDGAVIAGTRAQTTYVVRLKFVGRLSVLDALGLMINRP
jgi:hypothetical protein